MILLTGRDVKIAQMWHAWRISDPLPLWSAGRDVFGVVHEVIFIFAFIPCTQSCFVCSLCFICQIGGEVVRIYFVLQNYLEFFVWNSTFERWVMVQSRWHCLAYMVGSSGRSIVLYGYQYLVTAAVQRPPNRLREQKQRLGKLNDIIGYVR